MAKNQTLFTCQSCGTSHPKWQGQCGGCGEWNTLVEEVGLVGKSAAASKKRGDPLRFVVSAPEVGAVSGPKKRLSTTIGELDRVLGGESSKSSRQMSGQGMVPGAVMLLGGEPGVGKSTLLTQVVIKILSQNSKKTSKKKTRSILYVCGEENPSQISLRINRILNNEQDKSKSSPRGASSKKAIEQLLFAKTTDVDALVEIIEKKVPSLLIVDSIQTLSTTELTGASGSVGQIRECSERIANVAKRLAIPTFLVGHVTKDGTIAGPKVLEHMVDAVLELSGERTGQLRILRAVKNRFGATDEVGLFQLTDLGLEEVENPSAIFLEHSEQSVPGSATVNVMEGTRPLLVEVQSLVVGSKLAMPRRVGRGIQLSRIQVLAAVLQKHCRLPLAESDIFVSAAGGFSIREPAVDLGLAVAMASSLRNIALPPKTVFIGEVGLLGEVRSVSFLDRRIKEAKRLGFTSIYSRKTHESVRDVLKSLKL